METEPQGPTMRNKAQAKLSQGNYPHVSSRFEVQTSTKGQPKDQNSIFLAISTPLATRRCGYRASYSGPTKPVIEATVAQTKLLRTRAVHAAHVQGTPDPFGAAKRPPPRQISFRSAKHHGPLLALPWTQRNATEDAATQTHATGLLHARAVHDGPFVGHQVPTAPPRGRRLAKTRYR